MYTDLVSALKDLAKPKKEGGGAANKNRISIIQSHIGILENPPNSMVDGTAETCWMEEHYLGISLTSQRIDAVDTSEVTATCKDILNGKTGFLLIGVQITQVKEHKTKRGKNPGQKMGFLVVSDSSCSLDNVVAFPDVWKEYGSILSEGNLVIIQGEKDEKGSFIIQKVWEPAQR